MFFLPNLIKNRCFHLPSFRSPLPFGFNRHTLLQTNLWTAYPRPSQIGFQEPATPVMEGIIDFHHDLMFFLIYILGFVVWFLVVIGYSFYNRFPSTRDLNMEIYKHHINFIRVPKIQNFKMTNTTLVSCVIFGSPLEIFEITTFDCFGLEFTEVLAFVILSVVFAYITGNTIGGEAIIEDEDDDDFELDLTQETTDSLIADNIGNNDDDELNSTIQTVFQAVLFSNLANLLPFGDSNSNYIIFTIYLAGTCFLALNFNGFLIHTFNMVKLFLPQGVPSFLKPMLFIIEFISYFARLFSLGIRLFANMMSGHILIAILSTFAVILFVGLNFGSFASLCLVVIVTCIFFLEMIISYLQAYVFGMLVTIYYGDALNLHHWLIAVIPLVVISFVYELILGARI